MASTADVERLTREVLCLIAKRLNRKQRSVLRLCGKLLRQAANDCVETLVLTPMFLFDGQGVHLLNTSFANATRLIIKGAMTASEYTWILSGMDAPAFFSRLKELDMLQANCNELFLVAALDLCKQLECLKTHIDDAGICKLRLVPSLTTLKRLELQYKYNDDALASLSDLSNLVGLEHLSVGNNLAPEILSTLSTNLANLTSLQLIDNGDASLDLTPLQNFPALQQLDLQALLSKRTFSQLLRTHHLGELKLRLAAAAGADLVPILPRLCELKQLVELTVAENSGIYLDEDNIPQHYTWNLPHGLTKLAVWDALGRETSRMLGNHAPHLEVFHTNQLPQSVELLRQLAARTRLRDLEVPFSRRWAFPTLEPGVAPGTPMPVLPHVTRLATNVHHWLHGFLKQGPLPALRELRLQGEPASFLEEELPPALRHPEDHSADNVIVALVADGLQIEHLEVVGCGSLTNAGLAALMGMRGLRVLRVEGCVDSYDRLSYRGVKVLRAHPSLEVLEVEGTDAVVVLDNPMDGGGRLMHMSGRPGLRVWFDE